MKILNKLKKITAFGTALVMAAGTLSAAAYNDVPADYKYGDAVAFLTNSGVVQGDGNGNFAPAELLSRGEFATMLDAAFDIKVDNAGEMSFSDVPDDAYYKDALCKLYAAGIISGKSDGIFAPDDTVTHEEAVKMIINAYELCSGESIIGGAEIQPADYNDVSDWAAVYMDKAMAYRIPLISDENTLSPVKALTRGEAAALVTNALLCFGEIKENNTAQETYVIQEKMGNAYYTDEPAIIKVSTGVSLFAYELRDFYNVVVKKGYAKARDGIAEIDITDLGIGYYSFRAYMPNDSGEEEDLFKTFFCIIDRCDFSDIEPENAKFGINMHIGSSWQGWSAELLDLVNLAGVRIIRDASWWANVERQRGVYSNSIAISAKDYLEKYDIDVMDVAIQTNNLYDNGATPWSEDGINGLANFADALTDTWYGRMNWVDILNEFEATGDIGDGPADKKPESLYKIVKRAYEVIKENHPHVKTGYTAMGSPQSEKEGGKIWDERFYELGALNYIDYIATHNYPQPNTDENPENGPEIQIKEQYDFQKELIDKYNHSGHEIDLVLNETGGHTANYSGGITYREQAEYAPRILASALSAGYDQIIWYALINDGHNENINEQNYGLLYSKNGKYGDWAPKPSFQAYCVAVRKLSKAESKGTVTDGKIYKHEFVTEDGKDLCVLNSLRDTEAVLYTNEPVIITDIMGKAEEYTPINGKIYLTLDTEPLYIEGTVDVKEETIPVGIDVKNAIINSTSSFGVETKNLNTDNVTMVFRGEEKAIGDRFYIDTDKEVFENTLSTVIKKDGKPFAKLRKDVEYKNPYDLTVEENTYADDDLKIVCDLKFTIMNNRDEAAAIGGIEYTFGDREGTVEINDSIPPHSSKTYDYSIDDLTSGMTYDGDFRVVYNGENAAKADATGRYDYNILPRGKMVIDGVVDSGLENLKNCLYIPSIGFEKAVLLPGGLADKNDYDAQAWVSYDDTNLYICVDTYDDKHFAPSSGSNIWSNDSIQLAFYGDDMTKYVGDFPQGMDILHYYEIGVSLLDNGKMEKAIWRDVANGTVPQRKYEYKYVVKRDANTKHTVYEVAMPWDTIYPLSPERLDDLRMSIVAVENDGNGRDGWLEWGGGIAYEKNPLLFKHLHFLKK